ncbi:MAG: hypothetical protein MUO38_10635 [Anaerolineales bacterium]|nr:hypothetical protein [Anaerolineales bacterium]
MPLLRDWDLPLDVDQVLRAQGADPAVLRARRPALVDAAEQALQEGLAYLAPVAAYRELAVESLRHERLFLTGGVLTGPLVAQHLRSAQQVVVLACTIGDALERVISEAMSEDPVRGLALDGLGSAAAEGLAAAAAAHFEDQARARGLHTTIPLSPGMVGWPVEEGQAEIFSLVDGGEAGISLTSGGMMVPRKSISLVLGVGKDVAAEGRSCDFCNLRETCRYQDHYA